ncbi:thioester reductase domain-containing protein [Propionivibrio sp.]|uniref:thioester reductase domain-containing protein n=1 Tax=Propionivibrio sp. TaxID=2212460 RepID=UPI0026187665|nr:thioester reductase domain-containing protein [Propionivibrio sp.]
MPPTPPDYSWLSETVAQCLKVPVGTLDAKASLTRYGMDSLAAVEIATAIGAALECDMPDTLLIDCPSIAALERYLDRMQDSGQSGAGEALSLRDQMLADCVLPAAIDPRAAAPAPAVQAILLTGATGFLGAHVLTALLQETEAVVFCLTRPSSAGDGRARIRKALAGYDIGDAAFDSRLRIVDGDLQEPALGLSAQAFDDLGREIDAIYHCAAAVNWTFSYAGLRDTNVLATRELLRLACTHKRKAFHFVSSAGVCFSTAGPREIGEEDDMLPFLDGIHLGYAQSKCVAETLVRRASERGLPAAIYRPTLLTGAAQSGISNTGDMLSLLIKSCIEMRCAPDLDWLLDCCPVDHAATAIVKLSRVSDDSLRVFHLANPVARHWRESVLWMNLYGYPIRLVSYRSWLAKLALDAESPAHPLHLLRSFFLARRAGADDLTLPQLYEEGKKSRFRCEQTNLLLAALSVHCPSLNAALLERYFMRFISQRFLPGAAGADAPAAVAVALDGEFFTTILRRFHRDESIQVAEVCVRNTVSEHSIISELTSWKYGHMTGLRHCSVATAGGNSVLPARLELMVKMKPKDDEAMAVGESVAALCGDDLGFAFSRFKERAGLALCHQRELAIYEQQDERFVRHAPVLFGSVSDDSQRAWILVLEKLEGMLLMDSADDISGWHRAPIDAAVRGIAEVHAIWYRREPELMAETWLGPVFSAAAMSEMKTLWVALANHSERYFAAAAGCSLRALQQRLIVDLDAWWPALENLPRTLIHNDFNPRNIALRETVAGLRLCAYDWELATLGVPQHDLAEFLCFVLTPDVESSEVLHFLELHRLGLQDASGQAIDAQSWLLGFRLSLYDLIINRFPMYAMIHRLRKQGFLQRVVRTWRTLYELFPYRSD